MGHSPDMWLHSFHSSSVHGGSSGLTPLSLNRLRQNIQGDRRREGGAPSSCGELAQEAVSLAAEVPSDIWDRTLADISDYFNACSTQEAWTQKHVPARRHKVLLEDGCLVIDSDVSSSGGEPPAPKRVPLFLACLEHAEASRLSSKVPRYTIIAVASQDTPAVGDMAVWLMVMDRSEPALNQVLTAFSACGAIRSGIEAVYDFAAGDCLGTGACATVYRAQARLPSTRLDLSGLDHEVAVKAIRSQGSAREIVAKEVNALVLAGEHRNIIGFRGLFRVGPPRGGLLDGHDWALSLQLCARGDMTNLIRVNGACTERHAAKLLSGLLSGLEHLTQRGIIHRDVKPDNVLLVDDCHPVLCDFGIAAQVSNPEDMAKRCGSPGFVAPEVLRGEKYDSRVDVFGAGAILAFILSGVPAFTGRNVHATLRSNLQCKLDNRVTHKLSKLSDGVRDLIMLHLLQSQPDKRPTAARALLHRWFSPSAAWERDQYDSSDEVVAHAMPDSPCTTGVGSCASTSFGDSSCTTDPFLGGVDPSFGSERTAAETQVFTARTRSNAKAPSRTSVSSSASLRHASAIRRTINSLHKAAREIVSSAAVAEGDEAGGSTRQSKLLSEDAYRSYCAHNKQNSKERPPYYKERTSFSSQTTSCDERHTGTSYSTEGEYEGSVSAEKQPTTRTSFTVTEESSILPNMIGCGDDGEGDLFACDRALDASPYLRRPRPCAVTLHKAGNPSVRAPSQSSTREADSNRREFGNHLIDASMDSNFLSVTPQSSASSARESVSSMADIAFQGEDINIKSRLSPLSGKVSPMAGQFRKRIWPFRTSNRITFMAAN